MSTHREALATATEAVVNALRTGHETDALVAVGTVGRLFELIGPDMVTRKAKVALEGTITTLLSDWDGSFPNVTDWLRQLRDALLRM
jgi:hypothetical protein